MWTGKHHTDSGSWRGGEQLRSPDGKVQARLEPVWFIRETRLRGGPAVGMGVFRTGARVPSAAVVGDGFKPEEDAHRPRVLCQNRSDFLPRLDMDYSRKQVIN